MLKDWEKFHSDYKKLKATADRYTDKVAGGHLKQITQSKTACDTGETDLTQAVQEAREAGVTGKTLDDFLKFKAFAAAKKKMDTAVTGLRDDIKDLTSYCGEAQKVSDQVVALHKALEKDLKSRKSFSDGRKETEAVLAAMDDEYQRLMIVVAHKDRPARTTLIYVDLFPKTLAKIISNAPKVGAKANADLPDMFDLSTLKDKVTRALTGSNKVIRASGEATEAMPADPAAATKALKTARDELDKLKTVDRDYREAAIKHHKLIEAAPERAKIEKLVASIAKSLQAAERAVLAAAAELKKG